jgi:hypothetical protein
MLEVIGIKSKNVKIEVTREFFLVHYLRRTAKSSFEMGKSILETSESSNKVINSNAELHFISSLVFCAFSLEAFFNQVGTEKISNWEHLERLQPLQKLDLIIKELDVSFDKGVRPYQTVGKLFCLRNFMAHGKPIKGTSPLEKEIKYENDEEFEVKLRLFQNEAEINSANIIEREEKKRFKEWEGYLGMLNPAYIERALEDTEKIISSIAEKAELIEIIELTEEMRENGLTGKIWERVSRKKIKKL